ncbi:VWA domain-containing protein [Vibrio metschnikovii]|uniref:VWA domain-containing protein n=1 Tax=Vibrio metschnikovii TaxID=28172 RepID=UPI001C30178E|nr:VWA domain-containing protein [Vibrio metschnikovii]
MSEFMFLSPLWLLGILPVGLVLIWLLRYATTTPLIAPHLAQALGLAGRQRQSLVLGGLGVCWLIALIALAGPSFEKQPRPSYSQQSGRVVVMDMSRSLYATDIKPNRLSQARYKVFDLLNGWQEGSTGLVAYAGDAYIVSPLTTDTATIASLVPNLSPSIMPLPGANAAAGVALAIEMLQQAGFQQGDILLIADDLSANEASAISALVRGKPWQLSLFGIGTESGAPIAMPDGTLLNDQYGQPVIAKTNFSLMQDLANEVQGLFVAYRGDDQDVTRLLSATQSQYQASLSTPAEPLSVAINQGYWLILLLILPAALLFRRGYIWVALLTLSSGLTVSPAHASAWLNQNQQALRAYQQGDYQTAARLFSQPEWQGVARYQAGDYQGAIDVLSQIKNPSEQVQYNLANAFAQAGELTEALQRYQHILANNPQHADAQHNLMVVKQALEQQQQQQQQKSDADDASSQEDSSPSNEANPSSAKEKSSPQNGDDSHSSAQSESPQDNSPNAEPSTSSNTDTLNTDEKTSDSAATPTEPNASEPDLPHEPTVDQTPASTQESDPLLRRLEQVESARDPSLLLRAQLYLQAQEKSTPQNQGNPW